MTDQKSTEGPADPPDDSSAHRSTARYADVPGGQVHVQQWGHGEPVVLLHDAGSSSAGFAAIAGTSGGLASDRTVLAPDLIGAGGTTVDDAQAGDLDVQADTVAAALRACGVISAPVAGDGAGAAVAFALAARHPDLVTGVVVLGEPATTSGDDCPPPWPAPDGSGSHLLRIWDEVRDGMTFRPWWRRQADSRLRRALPQPDVLHQVFLDVAEHGGAHRSLARSAAKTWSALTASAELPVRAVESDVSSAFEALPPGALSADSVESSTGLCDYLRTSVGQIHLRRFGSGASGRPVLLLHSNPGSGAGLEALARSLGAFRPTVVWDTPGHGRSDDLPEHLATNITLGHTYAPILVDLLDRLGIQSCDVYGTHTGAGLAVELAIAAPDRVESLVLDGVPLFDDDPELVASVLANYFTDLTPDSHGSHLRRAWAATADMALWWPHYNHTVDGIREVNGYLPDFVHRATLDMLRSAPYYYRYYRAAWTWPATQRLPLVTRPVLVGSTPTDPLRAMTPTALALLPVATEVVFEPLGEASSAPANARIIADFLGRGADSA